MAQASVPAIGIKISEMAQFTSIGNKVSDFADKVYNK
jgi:hypothetical protein